MYWYNNEGCCISRSTAHDEENCTVFLWRLPALDEGHVALYLYHARQYLYGAQKRRMTNFALYLYRSRQRTMRPEARGAYVQTNHLTRAHGSPHWVPSPLSLSLPPPLDSLRHLPSRAVRGPR